MTTRVCPISLAMYSGVKPNDDSIVASTSAPWPRPRPAGVALTRTHCTYTLTALGAASALDCVAVREDATNDWCNLNCNFVSSYCPSSHCSCSRSIAVNSSSGGAATDDIAISIRAPTNLTLRRALRRPQAYKFGEFYSPIMNDGDFDAKPMVLLIGQYSTGKTSWTPPLPRRQQSPHRPSPRGC